MWLCCRPTLGRQVVFFWVLLARSLLASRPEEIETNMLLSVETVVGSC